MGKEKTAGKSQTERVESIRDKNSRLRQTGQMDKLRGVGL